MKEHNAKKKLEHNRISQRLLEDLLKRFNEEDAVKLIDSLSKITHQRGQNYGKMMSSITKLWYCAYVIYAILIIFLAHFIYDRIQSVERHAYSCDLWPLLLKNFSEKAWYGDQVAPVILSLPNFTYAMNKYEKWSNNSFLTFIEGYRMCLVVKKKTINKDIDTISVSLHLMKGPYDDQLQNAGLWPLSGNFTIELLSQLNDREHYSQTIVLNEDTCRDCVQRVMVGEITKYGYGVKFPSYKMYLKDNTLYFRVSYKMDTSKLVQNTEKNPWPIILKYYSEKSWYGHEVAPVILKMSNFTYIISEYKKWSSSPFLMLTKGYKMCLTVTKKTIGKDSDTISVNLYLVKGPYDDQLQSTDLWQLSGNFTIELLNQLDDRKHYSHTIAYTCSYCLQQLTKGERAHYGYEVTFPLYKMYLKDDTLYFRVSYLINN